MTVSVESQPAGINAGKVFCSDCNRHLGMIHNGYEMDSPRLTNSDMEVLEDFAGTHDKKFPAHNIRIIIFERSHL